MARDNHSSAREERLAARLRENLRRRKAQARAKHVREGAGQTAPAPLSKPPPKS